MTGSEFPEDDHRVPAAFLAANAAALVLFASILVAIAIADYPTPDEAMTFLGLQRGDTGEYESWPAYMKVVAAVVYHFFGISSVRGFQLVGALLATSGAVGVNYLILTRFKLPMESRILCIAVFDLFLIANTELHKYAAFVILLYPMRILAGFIFVYILAVYSSDKHSPPILHTMALGIVLAILTFAHPILAIPESAMMAALGINFALKRQSRPVALKRWMIQSLILWGLPCLVGGLVVLLSPHPEFAAPRDEIHQFYFFLNDSYSKSPLGLLQFLVVELKQLLLNICLPTSLVPRVQNHQLLEWIPFLFFSVGATVSCFRKGEVRFVLAMFVLVDIILRLSANMTGRFPFGGIERYALSQIFSISLLMSLGVADAALPVLRAISRACRGRAEYPSRPPKWGYMLSGAVFAVAVSAGLLLCAKRTTESFSLLQEQTSIRNEYRLMEGDLFVMESTTYATMHYYVGEDFYTRNRVISIPKMYLSRDITPEALNELEDEISKVGELHIVSQFEFNEKNFREAFRAVDAHFERDSTRESLRFSFSTWKFKTDGQTAPDASGINPAA